MPVLIHGDASFAGQGVVAETFNLEGLAGYSTGGTLHLIANNQVGFTTDPSEGRSTRYSSDLAKGFDAPIVHVNADDPEAAIAGDPPRARLPRRFGHDVVVDLVGYRRFGHNEQDEPAYTQPLHGGEIAEQPTAREQYAERARRGGRRHRRGGPGDGGRPARGAARGPRAAEAGARRAASRRESAPPPGRPAEVVTAVAAERLRALDAELVSVPDGFTVNPKLARQLERRAQALGSAGSDGGGIDWGHAEALAFGEPARRRHSRSA